MSTTTDMRLQALERANDIRLARADLKRRIERGEVFAASVLLDLPPEANGWAIAQFLTCQRRWGTVRMRNVLSRLAIPETKHLGALTDRQRRVLARALGWQEEER